MYLCFFCSVLGWKNVIIYFHATLCVSHGHTQQTSSNWCNLSIIISLLHPWSQTWLDTDQSFPFAALLVSTIVIAATSHCLVAPDVCVVLRHASKLPGSIKNIGLGSSGSSRCPGIVQTIMKGQLQTELTCRAIRLMPHMTLRRPSARSCETFSLGFGLFEPVIL